MPPCYSARQGAREDLRVVSDPGRVLLSPSHRVHARSLASSLPSADREDRFDFFQQQKKTASLSPRRLADASINVRAHSCNIGVAPLAWLLACRWCSSICCVRGDDRVKATPFSPASSPCWPPYACPARAVCAAPASSGETEREKELEAQLQPACQ